MKPVKSKSRSNGGRCDNCGKDLEVFVWRLGESTGCSQKCATSDFDRDLEEFRYQERLEQEMYEEGN